MPDVRPVRVEDLPAYLRTVTTAFQEIEDIDKLAADVATVWDLGRVWAAFEGPDLVGTFRSWATEMTVPGGAMLPGAAVSGVTVLPTHRRRGILREMAASEHRAQRERGEAVSLLYAAEYPIYGRFGYGPGTRWATWNLDATVSRFHGHPTGSTRFLALDATSRDACRAVFEAHRARTPGELRRRDISWDLEFAQRPSPWSGDGQFKGWVLGHHDDDGTLDGYARYHVEGHWAERKPRNRLLLDELHATTDAAERALWQALAEMDWTGSVQAERRSPSDRLPWRLIDGRTVHPTEVGDALWVRLHDVPGALEARTYEREGSVVLEVIDAEPFEGRQRLRLEAGPDGATCTRTTTSADLTIHVAALGAAYLGGSRLSDAVIPTGVDEHRPGALAAAEGLLRGADEPWCSTFF